MVVGQILFWLRAVVGMMVLCGIRVYLWERAIVMASAFMAMWRGPCAAVLL